jgi:hypothetical protein
MAMSPITRTINSVSYTFFLAFVSIERDTLFNDLSAHGGTDVGYTSHDPFPVSAWASKLAATPTFGGRICSEGAVIAVLAQALIGGMSMAPGTAADTAERLYRNQMDRAVDRLVGTIAQACVAAG